MRDCAEPVRSTLTHDVTADKWKNQYSAATEATRSRANAAISARVVKGSPKTGVDNLNALTFVTVNSIAGNILARSNAILRHLRLRIVYDLLMWLLDVLAEKQCLTSCWRSLEHHVRIQFHTAPNLAANASLVDIHASKPAILAINLLSACAFAKLHSIVAAIRATNAAVLVSAKPPSVNLPNASLAILTQRFPQLVTSSRLNISVLVFVVVRSNVETIRVRTFAIRALARPVGKLSLTKYHVLAAEPFCSLLYHVGHNRPHAVTSASDRSLVGILKSSIRVIKTFVCVGRRPSRINNAGCHPFAAVRYVGTSSNVDHIHAENHVMLLANAKTPEVRCNASKSDPEGNRKKELKCDDECARLERNRKLALALNIDQETHTDDHVPYSVETLRLYQELGVQWAQQQEREFRVFAIAEDEKRLRFKPMTAGQRRFLHVLAEDFGIDSESMDPEPHRHVFLYKTPRFVSAPNKTVGECIRIRGRQRMDGKSTPANEDLPRKETSNLVGDPFNGFLLTNPRFGLTIDELRTTVENALPAGFLPHLDINFLPSDEVALRTRMEAVPQGRTIAAERESEVVLKNAKLTAATAVSAKGLGKLQLCRVDDSLNVTRREADEAPTGSAGGWSQVAAKGASRRDVKPTTAPVQGRNGFEILGQGNKVVFEKKKDKKQKPKKQAVEVADDWEKAMSEEEEREKIASQIGSGDERATESEGDPGKTGDDREQAGDDAAPASPDAVAKLLQIGASMLLRASDTNSYSQTFKSLIRNAKSSSRWPQTGFMPARCGYATVQSDIFKPTKYGGKYTVTLIPGDGIGAEVSESMKSIFKADNVPIEWEQVDVSGVDTGNKNTEELFRESIASLKRNKLGLKGTSDIISTSELRILHTPVERSGHASFNVALRQELDIYASIVLIKNIPGYETRHKNVDLCIIRENTEGEYSGLEHQSVPGVVESLKIITRAKSERIAKFAFSFALANNRKKVTCIHKANIMKLADGLFRNTVKKVGEDYPTIETNDMIVDNASMQCVSRPQQFDVMVMPNLYGGILSNIGAGLVGGPGVIPGCNMGREVAVFEPGCRHVGLDIQGKDQANPTALLLSGAMLLRHLGLDDHANRISKAVYEVIADGKARTRDMGGQATTHQYTRAVLDAMEHS
ncbi:MAG: isocitrate dehydrogenase (NAD(+)) idh1 [Bogoriella megaspora]|nr:MAG: isocitrate dehydrogenase (NAD(+)) idh1 [Bogoriella megaspora]